MTGAPGMAQQAVLSSAARGSSFNAAMQILPRARREAMLAIYAFCRAVDDIADENRPREARMQALGYWRARIAALYAGKAACGAWPAGLEPLGEAVARFGLRREDFLAVIEGMEMDVEADVRAPDLATLDLYCDRVASAVGRLSACAFGMPEDKGQALAHHLGRALQLTNILRDLDEDAARGRLYLPREDLLAAGIAGSEPKEVLESPALGAACAPVIARAKAHFLESRQIMARCPRWTVRAPRIMAEAYFAILTALEKRGFAPPRQRIRTPRHRVLLAILRYGFI